MTDPFSNRFCRDWNDPDGYSFFHWHSIDCFVYFSHNLVTIPPVSWINAAHVNGVPVLGTFITEGVAICEEFLWDEEIVRVVVHKLVEMANHYQFQGWLINIENNVKPQHLENLLLFIRLLKHEMRRHQPESSQVIWYDSVIYPQGFVMYQNCLNFLNSRFFHACDGIYLNYNWDKNLLQSSIVQSARHDRTPRDIWVGVDCFGRGCFGGGGWNTVAAIEEIRNVSKDLSIAIFAPGWVHENLGSENFLRNQIKFWNKLQLPLRHVPSEMPIETSFCRGSGTKFFLEGRLVDERKAWFNVSSID